jgi:hypothetical protein
MKKFRKEILEIVNTEEKTLKGQGITCIKKKLKSMDKSLIQFEYQKRNMSTGTKLLSFYV